MLCFESPVKRANSARETGACSKIARKTVRDVICRVKGEEVEISVMIHGIRQSCEQSIWRDVAVKPFYGRNATKSVPLKNLKSALVRRIYNSHDPCINGICIKTGQSVPEGDRVPPR